MQMKIKKTIVNIFFSYDDEKFVDNLMSMGISRGDVIMVHSSWLSLNGFKGRPVLMVNALKRLIGETGLLIMPSLSYQNESTADYLRRRKVMNVKRTPSMMGLLSEVFRRGSGVRRSLSPTHSLVAWGNESKSFVAGHEACQVPFGKNSPFDKLLKMNGKILTIDAPFSTITFTHFLEDRIASHLNFPLYEESSFFGKLIDYDGEEHEIEVKVLSRQANNLRREQRLINELNKQGVIKRRKVGNTQLMLIDCKAMSDCVDEMIVKGDLFFDSPKV